MHCLLSRSESNVRNAFVKYFIGKKHLCSMKKLRIAFNKVKHVKGMYVLFSKFRLSYSILFEKDCLSPVCLPSSIQFKRISFLLQSTQQHPPETLPSTLALLRTIHHGASNSAGPAPPSKDWDFINSSH